MKAKQLHPWQVTPAQAIKIQNQLRNQVSCHNEFDKDKVKTVAGVDIGVKNDIARAAVVVLSFPDLELMDQSVIEQPVKFKYIPGLLSFRECPSIAVAFEKLSSEPDLIIVDGQGIAHPRRFGIASHLGLLLDKPTIGCAKSRLCGRHEETDEIAGSFTYLYDDPRPASTEKAPEIIGAALRTKNKTKVVYVSIGHKIDLKTSIEYVLNCCQGYRLPETTRFAHSTASGEPLPKRRKQQKNLWDE